MVSWPTTEEHAAWLRNFFRERNIHALDQSAHFLCWTKDNEVLWVSALDNWVGKTATAYFASVRPGILMPRKFIESMFFYAFRHLGLKALTGLTDEANVRSIRMGEFLGFRKVYTHVGCAESGGDLRLSEALAVNCRFLKGLPNAISPTTAGLHGSSASSGHG